MTTKETYDNIVLDKNDYPELLALEPTVETSQNYFEDIESGAKTATWRNFTYIIAHQISQLIEKFIEHKAWIENRAKEIQVGSLRWYTALAKSFQYGDALVWNATKLTYEYAVDNPAAKIVGLASSLETGSGVLIKTAKLVGGEPEPLTTPELDALEQYLLKTKFAGVKVEVVSRAADLFRINLKVYYDPLVLSSTGELISSPGTYPVEDAITSYLKDLPFDGKLNITDIIDRVQLSEGVINPIFQQAFAKSGSLAYQPITSYYTTNAGYLTIDPDYALNTTISYFALS